MSSIVHTVNHDVRRVTRRRRIVALTIALLLAQAVMLVGVAAPAQAHDCGGPYRHAASSVARVDFVWDPQCSDGSAFIGYASIEDTNCDGRSAQAWFDIYDRNSNGTYSLIYHSRTFKATNGCGHWASIPDFRPPSTGEVGWRVGVVMQACSWSCSWPEEDNFYG